MQSVALLLIGIHIVYAGRHSLQYFYTATSGIPDFPQFVTVGHVDGQPFTYYDSNIRKLKPRQDWMAKSEGENYWEDETRISIETEQHFMTNIDVAKKRFNQTEGVHTFQQIYGCEWDDETGEIDAFRQKGYDGENFLSLDWKNFIYISSVQQGFLTVQKWNNDKPLLKKERQYFSTECIKWLKMYLKYGKSSLEKTVSPQVSLLQKDPSSPVTCHATGFYPREVTISWMKNGQDHHEDVDLSELLPNEDGTFQQSSTLKVTADERKNNKFSCVVEHQGKTVTEDKIRTTGGDSVSIGIIVGVLAAVVLLILIGAAGYVVYKKKQGCKPVSGSDDGSNSSTQAVPKA